MDNKETNKDKLTKELENENDAMKQSVMVARILADVSQQYERYFKRMWIVLIASIIANLIIVGAFLWYESQMETTTTTTTVEQDTGTGNGNAVYFSGESAQYHDYQPKKDGVNNGEAENNNSDNNPQTQNQ